MAWFSVCAITDLQLDSGVCALLNGQQIALFYMTQDDAIYAVNNYDPFGDAQVLSRGLIGDINGQPMVASPLYKQHFNLKTGVCLEDSRVTIPVYPVRVVDGDVQVNIDA